MRKLALTFAGGFCGATTRYALSAPLLALTAWATGARLAFPYDILLINLSGAFLLGGLYGLFEHGAPLAPDVRLTLGTGFLGAFTTFSSFAVGGDQLLEHGEALAGALYILGSMAGGVALAFAGFRLAGLAWQRAVQARVAPAGAAPGADAWIIELEELEGAEPDDERSHRASSALIAEGERGA